MSVKFFGQFLIEQGEIDAGQLREALDLMRAENKQLGEIAVQKGFLRQSDADWINLQQRTTDQCFGELAQELELLTAEQLTEVVKLQQETRLFIGEALVQLDSLNGDELPTLLDQFKTDQSPYQSATNAQESPQAESRLATLILDLLPKFCMRTARLNVKAGSALPEPSLERMEHRVGIKIYGPPSIEVIIDCDREFGRLLAAGVSGIDPERLSQDLISDGVGEFLNIVGGNAVAVLERDGIVTRLGPPEQDCRIDGGTGFDLAVGEGRASLVLIDLEDATD